MTAPGEPVAARPVRTVLVVDDDALLRRVLTDALRAEGARALSAGTLAEALATFGEHDVDVVALDEQLPDGRGHTICAQLLALRPGTKIIFMTAFPEFDHAVKAIRAGAYDYLSKPFELDAFLLSARRCVDVIGLEEIERRERYRRDRDAGEIRLVGDSPAFAEVRRLVGIAAAADAPVLITGETGTGKSLIAKAIHFGGPRRDRAFVPVSCAALPDHLIEGELFGWERGAFTGAVATREGAFEVAHGGTLFLDELGELPVHLQPKLLNVLEDGNVKRLGARAVKPIDARVIAATNAELERLVEEKSFRADLYYRLAVVRIHLPPLRERIEDIPALVGRLLAGICRTQAPPEVEDRELQRLAAYRWPGNVRELRNVLERAVLLRREGEPLRPSALIAAAGAPRPPTVPPPLPATPEAPFATLEEVEERHIAAALRRSGGNLAQAARALGVSLSTLKRRAKRPSDPAELVADDPGRST